MRIKYIDIIKGIAIYLVVLGHSIQFSTENYDSNLAFKYIYSFHMALFMCVSGFVAFREPFEIRLRARAKHLLIPFFVWPVIETAVNGRLPTISQYGTLLRDPATGLWFLWTLFFIMLFFGLASEFSRRTNFSILVVMAGLSLAMPVIVQIAGKEFGFGLISRFFIFFCLGFFMRRYIRTTEFFTSRKWLLFWAPLFLLTAPFWNRTGAPEFMKGHSNPAIAYAYGLVIATAGIFLTFTIARNFLQNLSGRVMDFVDYIGRNTLGIYAVQMIPIGLILGFWGHFHAAGWMVASTTSILALLLSSLFVFLAKKNRYVSLLTLGQ